MRAALASVKARFEDLDRGSHRTGWARLPRASSLWAFVMISTSVLTWNASWQLRPGVDEALSWSAQDVLDGYLWRAATATILTQGVFMIGSLLITTSIYLWLLERMTTPWLALATWIAGAIWGYLGTTIFLWACSTAGWDVARTALTTSDYGPSGGTAAVAAMVVVLLRHRLVTIASIVVLLVGSALHHQVADVEHIISFTTVLLLGPVALRRTRSPAAPVTRPGD